MKNIKVEIGVGYQEVRNGYEPITYKFSANAIENMCMGYGIVGGGRDCKSRTIEVSVPDWVELSEEHMLHICKPGTRSKSGSCNLCFVVCKKPVRDREYSCFGACDQQALIDEALAGGLELVYPDKNGEMVRMDVEMV